MPLYIWVQPAIIPIRFRFMQAILEPAEHFCVRQYPVYGATSSWHFTIGFRIFWPNVCEAIFRESSIIEAIGIPEKARS